MTDLEQRIREAYDAQHASEALRGRTLALLEEERKRRPDALLLRCIAPPCGVAREHVSSLLGPHAFCSRLPSSVPMACIVRRLLSWTLR